MMRFSLAIIIIMVVTSSSWLFGQSTFQGNDLEINADAGKEQDFAGQESGKTANALSIKDEKKDEKNGTVSKTIIPLFSIGASILFFIDDASLESDSMPILPSFFLAFSLPVATLNQLNISLGLSLDCYSTHYLWSEKRQRALPSSIENRSALVFGFPLGVQIKFKFATKSRLSLCLNLGASADCRLVLLAEDLENGIDDMDMITAEKNNINDYFWKDFNWLFLEGSFGIEYRISEKTSLEINGRVFTPVHQPERVQEDSALLGWRFGAGLYMKLRF